MAGIVTFVLASPPREDDPPIDEYRAVLILDVEPMRIGMRERDDAPLLSAVAGGARRVWHGGGVHA